MLENKTERFKTFLRKIDEKAMVRIKHFMQESNYPVDGSGGGVPAKLKKSRSASSKDGVKKVEPQKMSFDVAQMEIEKPHKTLTKQSSTRSQPFESDCKDFERTEGSGTQSSFTKHNATFHKLFPAIPESEDLIHAYICALQKEVPYHGRLYITGSSACFHSSVLLKDTKVVIPVSSIHIVKKQNTALLVPNALSIRTTEGEKFLFVSLRNREACYQLLRSVSPQLEDRSANNSPVISSAEHSFDKCKLVSSSQSSLEGHSDQCDGSDLPSLQDKLVDGSTHGETVPNEKGSTFGNQQSESLSSEEEGSVSVSSNSWVWNVTDKAKSLLVQSEVSTLNILLVIYLILVFLLLLSSGYIGLRIVALEEQLTSLGALPEFALQRGYSQDT
ncbi:GRAM domain-containing protein 2B isoform X1 [Nerophis ophidion]|uniref:GRAM domain-containing protein 2B isoform X1 n=1 Tax=Nerophis ophidion TaxID=159077 RepID=UPI002ADFD949|nr:GRAM domain-containing protein 2B isoform X1 [Nerophis ophidion]